MSLESYIRVSIYQIQVAAWNDGSCNSFTVPETMVHVILLTVALNTYAICRVDHTMSQWETGGKQIKWACETWGKLTDQLGFGTQSTRGTFRYYKITVLVIFSPGGYRDVNPYFSNEKQS
jgi:hypothetical protein